jgi:hypothetical protein
VNFHNQKTDEPAQLPLLVVAIVFDIVDDDDDKSPSVDAADDKLDELGVRSARL